MAKQKFAVTKPSKKSSKKADAHAVTHEHLQTAKLLENKSTDMLSDLHAVLEKHGFENASIQSLAVRSEPATMSAPAGLCRVWRCHTVADGTNECGWEWESC